VFTHDFDAPARGERRIAGYFSALMAGQGSRPATAPVRARTG
jgi:hypothetical protein